MDHHCNGLVFFRKERRTHNQTGKTRKGGSLSVQIDGEKCADLDSKRRRKLLTEEVGRWCIFTGKSEEDRVQRTDLIQQEGEKKSRMP
jgi:hypothetical protein